MAAATLTITPIGSGATEVVSRDGVELGSVTSDGPGTRALASINTGRFAMCRFATREDAIAACVSYADRGYWFREI